MKSIDLMVGDWYANSDGDICKVEKILGNIVWGQGDDVSDSTDDPNPITLTAEILENNGFVLRGKTYILKWRGADIHWRKTDGYASITAPNNLKLEGWCSISNGYFCYVHILQHALRLCGLDDLADNFKV